MVLVCISLKMNDGKYLCLIFILFDVLRFNCSSLCILGTFSIQRHNLQIRSLISLVAFGILLIVSSDV